MAFSSSINHAQVIKLCELCEENNIKWICMDCEHIICDKCKNIHLRTRGNLNHQVVTVTTPLKDIQRRIITDNIPCKDHRTKMMCLFCKTCECLICPDCVATHTKHQFVPIDSVVNKKRDQLKNFQSDIIDKIKVCESKSSDIEQYTSKYNSIFEKSVAKIKQRHQELIQATNELSEFLQDEAEAEKSKVENTLLNIEKEVVENKLKLEELRKEVETALSSNQGQKILEARIEKIQEIEFDKLPDKGEHFIPGTQEIQELFGVLQRITITTQNLDIELEIKNKFTTDLDSIHTIIPLDETTAWISGSEEMLRKVKITNNGDFTTLLDISFDICDMTLLNEKDILLTKDSNISDIRVLTESGDLKHFMTVAPIVSRAIHVTKDNDILVSVLESNDNKTIPSEEIKGSIVQYGIDGKLKHKYRLDENGKRLFTDPWIITENINGDIVVVDNISDCNGRVVCLDREGTLRWVYEGQSEFNTTEDFDPSGITTTSEGDIIVCDYATSTLHVLSGDGNVLKCIIVKDLGI